MDKELKLPSNWKLVGILSRWLIWIVIYFVLLRMVVPKLLSAHDTLSFVGGLLIIAILIVIFVVSMGRVLARIADGIERSDKLYQK